MKEIKRVMFASFGKNFFILNRNEINEKYLEVLIERACDNRSSRKLNYIEIADNICSRDVRIHTVFEEWNLYYLVIIKKYIEKFIALFNKYITCFETNFQNENFDAEKIQRIEALKEEQYSCLIIHCVLGIYKKMSYSDKQMVLSFFEDEINTFYSTKTLKKNNSYSVEKFSEIIQEDIIYQAILHEYCMLTNTIFNHQTEYAIEIFDFLDKENMYFSIKKQISHDFFIDKESSVDTYSVIIGRLLGRRIYTPKGNFTDYGMLSYFYDWIQESKENAHSLLNTIFELQAENNDAFLHIYKLMVEIGNAKKLQDALNMKIDNEYKHFTNEETRLLESLRERDNQIHSLQREIITYEKNQKELYALREMFFSLSITDNENEIESDNEDIKIRDYSRIMVIGGHTKWAKKIRDRIPNIDVISADQRIVNTSLLKNKKIILFYINYISHSLYLNAMSQIEEWQQVGFIKNKNVDTIIKEIELLYDDLN